ncbi:MAG: HAD family hydrolase [Gammaproteobacteria bacterium GWE2_42_36]|nr:MAG: HAD family hydrolase [Gammaproteobacteria bacterium GWE2_42_36]
MTYLGYRETPESLALHLQVDLSYGLTAIAAQDRLKEYGLNVLTKKKATSLLKIFLLQLNSLMIWVLLGAIVVSFLFNEKVDAIVIFAIVVLNAVIGFFLEYRADRAMLALQQLAAPKATVLRDGQAVVIEASSLIPGDILLLKSGDLIAADARVFEIASLKVNEAPLTGESLSVDKNIQSYPAETPLADRKNMIFMGTTIVNGTGKAIVTATGMKTEMGHIAEMLENVTRTETPLQKKLNQVGARILWICFAIVVLTFIVGLFRHIEPFKLFMSSVSLAVAAIPEGLPAVVTIALALGVQRMVRRAVLVRRLSAVETLGCLQVICTDKTGTLTVGEMTARKLMTIESIYTIQGEGYNLTGAFSPREHDVTVSKDLLLSTLLRAAVLCNNAKIASQNDQLSTMGDPTEIALLIAATKGNIESSTLESSYPRVKELPFNSERKRMTVVCQKDNQLLAFVKGAPESILDRCSHILTQEGVKAMMPNDLVRMQQSCQLMASEGLRILALAERTLTVASTETIDEKIENDLVFLGLIGLQDPPHAEAEASVRRCKMAGIKPIMITGDHPETASAIARALGIFNPGDRLVTGSDLDKMTQAEFIKAVKQITVYARVTAEHKLKIVRAWKEHQVVVAMTGDGVNDAPALKEASVGIAMGKTGTDVTKEASDMIVMDNNFASIIAGIEEGRTIYNNIAKALSYLLAGNIGELTVVFVALLIGWPLPLLPIQLLWINLITDGLPAIGLATDVPEPDILNRPPRDPRKPFMDAHFFRRIIFIGSLTSLITLAVFAYEYLGKGNLMQAQDAAFSVLVTAELLRSFGARSNTKPIWQIGVFSNIRLFFIVSISFSLQLLIHHVPLLQEIFGVGVVSLTQCLTWIGIGMIPLIVLELCKLPRGRLNAIC